MVHKFYKANYFSVIEAISLHIVAQYQLRKMNCQPEHTQNINEGMNVSQNAKQNGQRKAFPIGVPSIASHIKSK